MDLIKIRRVLEIKRNSLINNDKKDCNMNLMSNIFTYILN